jgi:two-component system OmpR family sensor kinase
MTSDPSLSTPPTAAVPVVWIDESGEPIAPEPPPSWSYRNGAVDGAEAAFDVAASPRRRLRWAPRTLTSRLVTGVVTLVVVLVLATGTGTYMALRSFLNNRLDQQVQTVASGDLGQLFTGITAPGSQNSRTPEFVWGVVLDPTTGTVLVTPTNRVAETLHLTSAQARAMASGLSAPDTISTTDGVELRVVTRSVGVRDGFGGPTIRATAVIGLSTDEVHRTLHRLIALEWAIGAAAIVLAFGATWWGVGFSLRRLRRVTSTAQEVAAELSPDGAGLDRRVPEGEANTEVGQLAQSMNTLLAAVETQFAARLAREHQMRQFLADASHELRTPLTSIRGFAELARMQRTQGALADDNLARIEAEGTRMSRLVDDLLTLARSDQGAEPMSEPVDLGAVVTDAVTGVRAAYPGRRIDLDVAFGVSVTGDRDQLLRVVRNLVTNAVVHTRADGPVHVGVAWEGIDAVLRVSDSGPGLPPQQASHVFERFWRADQARTRASGGSGLGLAIVSSIVAAHGGTVSFDSAVATGSTVTVRLPRQRA